MMYVDSIWGLWLFLSLSLGWTNAQQTNYTRPVFNCGGDLVADSGFVGSEGFPSFYKPNSKCIWRITVPEGNVVTLSFRIFDMEAESQCRYDYLDVYNGHSNLVQKLGRFCGTFRPGALISTTNTMMLEMVSDDENQSRGFVAFFSGTKPYLDDEQFCGGKMTKSQGEIKTPNWPEKKYPAGTSCSWLITVEPDMVIQVTFDKFILEADTYCRFDYVAFFNGGEKDDSRLIGKYCGDQAPQPIITIGNVLLVQFVSDLSVTSDGFLAHYTSVRPGSQIPTFASGAGTRSIPPKPAVKPERVPKRPATTVEPAVPTTKHVPPPPPEPTARLAPVKPPRGRGQGSTGQNGRVGGSPPNGKRLAVQNPLCAKPCKRQGTIKSSFCASEFVITGKVTSMSAGRRGTVNVNVSIIKAYKAGRLTITQVGETMSFKLVSQCKNCPLLRRGINYIIMGQVNEDGQGTLEPGAFTAPFKAPHHKLLMNINNQPC
ncbi:Procollagen C-endopeptidase enhancer 1 Procollagen COOH-terminal proteinase enhancer 1 [Channa argus]|uniref:Procollagen C-endopeptidase enhancer 1 Procollagen COOH-terminal proteinase enhancer 1 n=1 Tax=Channa argus TaxID=215402 RepID=A0A6G1QWM2_CHAAH|nr:Procollagen C-endopeptidase enhancer 1 Procollagen COOH-terminal proteinase enhancer 1 [Channa argus]